MALPALLGVGALAGRLLGALRFGRLGKMFTAFLTGISIFFLKSLLLIVGVALTAYFLASTEFAINFFSFMIEKLVSFVVEFMDNSGDVGLPDARFLSVTLGQKFAKLLWLTQVPQSMMVLLYFFIVGIAFSIIKMLIFRK